MSGLKTDSYIQHYKQGVEYENFIEDLFLERLHIKLFFYKSKHFQNKVGETHQGIEVKFDDRIKETGNIYFEYEEACKTSGCIPSGVFKQDNSWLYVIGDYSTIYVFSKNRLINFLTNSKDVRKVEAQSSKGYLVKKELAETIAEKIIKI